MEEKGILVNKMKYKCIFIEFYFNFYMGKYVFQRCCDRFEEKWDVVEVFKFWFGLLNKYYSVDDWKFLLQFLLL